MQLPTAPDPTAVKARYGLFIALGIFTLVYLAVLVRALRARAAAGERVASPLGIWPVSFVANFFDTLGIGSYATTTSMFRQWRLAFEIGAANRTAGVRPMSVRELANLVISSKLNGSSRKIGARRPLPGLSSFQAADRKMEL